MLFETEFHRCILRAAESVARGDWVGTAKLTVMLLLQSLALLLLIGSSAQQRVIVQKGPLYRTEGAEILIWCRDQGHLEPTEQTFEWSVYLPSAPDHKIQIMSTADEGFPHASYRERVDNREIDVLQDEDNQAVLYVSKIQASDTGEYECQVPITGDQSGGPHSARIKVNVIPDTLQVVPVRESFNKVEGDSVVLKCDVSSSTIHDARLFTISWSHRQQGVEGTKEILQLSKERVVYPGSRYTERYNAGDILLEKVVDNDSTYQLTMQNLQLSDQGEFFCGASELIVDPDASWHYLAGKQSGGIIVNVQAKD